MTSFYVTVQATEKQSYKSVAHVVRECVIFHLTSGFHGYTYKTYVGVEPPTVAFLNNLWLHCARSKLLNINRKKWDHILKVKMDTFLLQNADQATLQYWLVSTDPSATFHSMAFSFLFDLNRLEVLQHYMNSVATFHSMAFSFLFDLNRLEVLPTLHEFGATVRGENHCHFDNNGYLEMIHSFLTIPHPATKSHRDAFCSLVTANFLRPNYFSNESKIQSFYQKLKWYQAIWTRACIRLDSVSSDR